MTNATANAVELDLVDQDGRPFIAAFNGRLLAAGNQVDVYVTEDESLLAHDHEREELHEIENIDGLRDWLEGQALADAILGLGEPPTQLAAR